MCFPRFGRFDKRAHYAKDYDYRYTSEQKWFLQGRVAGKWDADLKAHWAETRTARRGRRCIVNLEDVTFIDGEGEGVLLEMAREGAELVSSRVYVRHLLGDLIAGKH